MRRTIPVCVVLVAIANIVVTMNCLAQNSSTPDQAPGPKVLAGPTLAAMIGGSIQ